MKRIYAILTIVFLPAAAFCEPANLVINPGFEIPEVIGNDLPMTYGDWDGDDAVIVASTSGITPYEGQNMLQFDKSFGWGWFPENNTCEVYQLLDISGYEDMITGGNAYAMGSVYFNRVAGDEQTDTAFGMYLMAYDGSPSTFKDRFDNYGYNSALSWVANGVYSDSNLLTWENVTTNLPLPVDTTFLVIKIAAYEDIYNDYEMSEFDGHFADMVSVQIVPEPTTILLLSFGAILALKKKSK